MREGGRGIWETEESEGSEGRGRGRWEMGGNERGRDGFMNVN